MDIEEQALIFAPLIIFLAPSMIFFSSYLLKKELAPMLIHVRKIFTCKVFFKSRWQVVY